MIEILNVVLKGIIKLFIWLLLAFGVTGLLLCILSITYTFILKLKYKEPANCPKCGRKAFILQYPDERHEVCCLMCNICTDKYYTKSLAIKRWNTNRWHEESPDDKVLMYNKVLMNERKDD